MMSEKEVMPLLYTVTYLVPGYSDRKPSYTILACSIEDAIEHTRKLLPRGCEVAEARWVESSPRIVQHVSQRALRHFQAATTTGDE